MTQYTSAYSRLLERLDEVELILGLARARSPDLTDSRSFKRINALCRSGVVLLSSHIEGYVEDLGELALEQISIRRVPKANLDSRLKYYLSKDLIFEIRDKSDPVGVAAAVDQLLQRDNHIWGPTLAYSGVLSAEQFLGDFASPSHKRIKKLFARFGYHKFHHDLSRLLAADFSPCSNMIDQVVDQRNKIAHGDAVAASTPSDLKDMILLSKKYCRAVDKVVGDWFTSRGCPIRV